MLAFRDCNARLGRVLERHVVATLLRAVKGAPLRGSLRSSLAGRPGLPGSASLDGDQGCARATCLIAGTSHDQRPTTCRRATTRPRRAPCPPGSCVPAVADVSHDPREQQETPILREAYFDLSVEKLRNNCGTALTTSVAQFAKLIEFV